jgi:hypothetical protein
MHAVADAFGVPTSRFALQEEMSLFPCGSRVGSSAILRPSVRTHAIAATGGVVTHPDSGTIKAAIKQYADLRGGSDILNITPFTLLISRQLRVGAIIDINRSGRPLKRGAYVRTACRPLLIGGSAGYCAFAVEAIEKAAQCGNKIICIPGIFTTLPR